MYKVETRLTVCAKHEHAQCIVLTTVHPIFNLRNMEHEKSEIAERGAATMRFRGIIPHLSSEASGMGQGGRYDMVLVTDNSVPVLTPSASNGSKDGVYSSHE